MAFIQYPYQQIRRVLKQKGLKMKKLWVYKQRPVRYDVLWIDTEEIFLHYVTMNQLRAVFTILNIPLDKARIVEKEEEVRCY